MTHPILDIRRKDIGVLQGFLIHEHPMNVDTWISKLNMYSSRDAKKWILERRNYNKFKVLLIGLLIPLFVFFREYIKHGYWKYGILGLFYSLSTSYNWTFKAFKYYEAKYLRNAFGTKKKCY